MKNPLVDMSVRPRSDARLRGFSLLELMIALAMFAVVSGAALSLFSQHQPLFNQQQNLAGVNIAMRNAVAQLQTDIVNGGAGYYSGINIPNFPVGVVISNNVVASGGDCRTGVPLTYGANCFDSLTVIVADPATTPVNILAGASASLPVTAGTCVSTTTDTSATTNLYVLPPVGITAATYSGNFKNGDQILLVAGDGSKYTTVKLTANGTTQNVGGTVYVLLAHSTKTNANGSNAAADDLTGMSVHSPDLTTSQFCATAWLVRLTPILYDVDLSNTSDPKLRRTVLIQGQTPAVNGVTVSEQIIGFKVGAALINGATDVSTYNFDASTFISASSPGGYDYTLVRSVMISMIGRTPPVTDPTYKFRNAFDGGAYETQGVSVVVNPRNMSMSD
jgi:prepilin-type N-terminal cleavage/methylation domain-containing protein